MKKILSYLVIILLVFSSNPGWSLAMEEILPPLEKEKEKTEVLLENLVDRVDITLEKADRRIKDTDQSEKIQEKQEEIQGLLEEARVSLGNADSKTEIKEILEDTKDIIVLKTSAALTPTDDITENSLFQELPAPQKQQAEDTLLSSLDSGEKNTIMIRSRSTENLIREKLMKYDETLTMNFQFEEDGYKIYEVIVSKESLLSEELLENLDIGEVPESILGIEIIRPELLQIGALDLTGEDRTRLWGIEKYTTPLYLESLEHRSSILTRKIRVGIIDTGIESTHKDLLGQINTTLGYDFVNEDSDPTDDQGHGTHVAGTIAANINGTGVFGVNPYVELVALKICDNKGFCPSYSVLKALSYAKEQNFDVLNMSLGARGNPETSPICSAVKDITAGGTIVVAAAGNSNVDTSTFVPGGCRAAITVAAVDESGKRAAFSNYGSKVDVAAPGVGIYSSYIGGGHKSLNGTSMATPHIVGLVSIIRTYRRDISTDGVKGLLQTYRSPVTSDANKSIAAGVDVSQLMSSLAGLQVVPDSEKKPEILLPKEEKKRETIEKTNTGMNSDSGEKQKQSTGSLADSIAIIDESIGLIIQNNEEKIEINSLGEVQRDAVEINNTDETVQSSTLLDVELIPPEVFTSEGVEVNNADEPIDFSQIDTSTGLMSTGDPKKLYGQEKTNIELSERDIPEGYTLINTDADEEYDVTLGSQEDPLLEESEDTAIQNIYNCTLYVGYTCSYNLPAASIRQYNMSNTSIASVSAGSSSFTITGRSTGSTVLYVNYAGRTIATIYITVQRMLVPIGANYGTNTLDPGKNTYLSIRSGNGGYSVSSSNTSIVSVSGYDTNWTLTANNPGTAVITYRDSAGYYGTVYMTVTAPPRNLSVSVGQTTIQKGKSTALTITDGNGGYSVSSSNPSIVSVSGNNTNWTLSAINPGTTSISIRDSRGRVTSITLTVTQVTPIRTLWFNYNSNPHRIGWVSTINITDGNGGYSVTSSNPAILSVSGGNTSWSLTANSPGSVIITVRDQRGMVARVPYTVLRQVSGNLSNISPFVGQSAIFTVTDGNGGYTLTSSNPSVATVRQTTTGVDTNYTITALLVGETIITIRDRFGSSGWIKMTVRPGTKSLTLDKSTLTVEVGSDAYFRVMSGNGGYSHSMSNGNVGWYYDNSSIPSYRVRGLTPGTTILQIGDSVGKVVQVRVEVVPKAPIATISNLEFSPSIRDDSMGGIYFEVEGKYKEAGIEYHYGDRLQPIVEKLVLQDDHAYATLYSLECADKKACQVYLKPYTIDTNGKKIYHKNYDGTNYIVVGYDLSGPNIANVEEEGVEVNNSIKETVASLRQIGVNIKRTVGEYKGVYDGSYDAVNDQLTELAALLDPETYKQVAREIKKLATKIVNGNYDTNAYIQKLKKDFSELSTVLDSAYSYLGQLTSYDKQYYSSYFSVSSVVTFIGPGKLKGTKSLKKIEDRAKEVIEKGKKLQEAAEKQRKIEEAAEKQRKIEETIRLAKVIADFKATKWTTSLKKHLFEGEIKEDLVKNGNSSSYRYGLGGVHYKTAIRQQKKGVNSTGDIRIKNKVDKGNGFYEANVEGYSSIKYEGGDKNNRTMLEDDKGWIKKEAKSTFFPDNWSEDRIRDEVAVAWGNKRLVTKTIGNETRTGNIGYTSDGYPIEFQINTDQSVKSAYANFFFK